jgi:ribosomal protein S18 acetylase RimI-like enzyme
MVEVRILGSAEDKAVLGRQSDLEYKMPYFLKDVVSRRTYVAAFQGPKVIGLLAINRLESNPQALWVSFVSTHTDHRNRGVASRLVAELFTMARRKGQPIVCTAYQELGRKYLRHVMRRTAKAYPDVSFTEQ